MTMAAASWTPEQREVYDTLARDSLRRTPRGRRVIAVEGRDATGKTRFADALAVAFRRAKADAYRASVDDFHNPRALRYRLGRDSAEGYYTYAFDYPRLKRLLLEPFRVGGSNGFQVAAFDLVADRDVEERWLTAGPDAVLIVDGVFLQRPVLDEQFDEVIMLVANDAERGRRLHARDGLHPLITHPSHDRYRLAHDRYEADNAPVENADVVIDNSDWRRPIVLSARD